MEREGDNMPRTSRKLSASKIYHVMIRGNERKALFHDDEDRAWFISMLLSKKRKFKFILYAYCLMDNHVHLVINEGGDQISRIMKGIQVSYAYYFNKKYARVGHLFQDRFRSEVIENDRYLLATIRYVHQNPVKAGMIKHPSEYLWSSYNHYLGNNKQYTKDMIDLKPILLMFSQEKGQALQIFVDFSNQTIEDTFIEYQEEQQLDKEITSENQAKRYIDDFLITRNVKLEELSSQANKLIRNELIRELKCKSNLSNRQIATILGVNRNVVQRLK